MTDAAAELKGEAIDRECSAVYLELPGSKVVNLQAYFDTYEGLGTVRTLDMRKSFVCVLTTPDMLGECLAALDSLKSELRWRARERPADLPLERLLGYFNKGR